VARWRALFAANLVDPPSHTISVRARVLAWAAGRFGSSLVLPLVIADETREFSAYLDLADHASQKATRDAALTIASETAEHAQQLAASMGGEGEPWHTFLGSGYLRGIVYGFNDGLTANFGLVAGVIGADVPPGVVIVTGVAGALADALSMGASGYLAAKSEGEVAARQEALEREEIRLMPDIEEDELALIYESKGLHPTRARELAKELMRDPESALSVKMHDELGIQPPGVSPWGDYLSRLPFCGAHAASFQRAAPIKPTAALRIVRVAQSADTRGEVTNDLPQHRPLLSHLFHMTGECSDGPLGHL
jgi:vacuolar iron transporter family protein